MPIELVFETHSTTEDNERGVATGWHPGKLSAAGREQARQMGRRRVNDGIEAIFASDLARATESVRIAFPDPPIPVFMDWRLRECNYGEMTGMHPDMIEPAEHLDVPFPAGESQRQVRRTGGLVRSRPPGSARLVACARRRTHRDVAGLGPLHQRPLERLVATPFEWQEGWEYRL